MNELRISGVNESGTNTDGQVWVNALDENNGEIMLRLSAKAAQELATYLVKGATLSDRQTDCDEQSVTSITAFSIASMYQTGDLIFTLESGPWATYRFHIGNAHIPLFDRALSEAKQVSAATRVVPS